MDSLNPNHEGNPNPIPNSSLPNRTFPYRRSVLPIPTLPPYSSNLIPFQRPLRRPPEEEEERILLFRGLDFGMTKTARYSRGGKEGSLLRVICKLSFRMKEMEIKEKRVEREGEGPP